MLYEHQKRIIAEDHKRSGIFLSTGGGKTRTALMLAEGSTLIIMPKTQFLDGNWHRESLRIRSGGLEGRITQTHYISKERFKRDHAELPAFHTVIIDEAHTVCGVTPNIRYRNRKPVPKASQIFEAVRTYLARTDPKRIYLATATPARNPMAVWAAATLLGHKLDWDKWRRSYYVRLPMPGREVWQPRKDEDARSSLANAVKGIGYVGRLEDWFDVPPQIDRFIHCPLSKEQIARIKDLPLEFPDPLVLVGKTHQEEQGDSKLEAIVDLLEEFPKVVIFARYLGQIETIKSFLEGKGIDVYIMTGATKDRKTIIEQAEASKRCAFIAQAQVSTGYELPSFRCAIFASMSYSYVDFMQAKGRNLRANALAKNLYVYLYSGKVDKAVLKCQRSHQDFSEELYAQTGSGISDKIQRLAPLELEGDGSLRAEADGVFFDPF